MLNEYSNFDVLLTVHLSIFISVYLSQYIYLSIFISVCTKFFFTISLFHASTCF